MGDRNKGAPPPIAIESWEQYEQLMLEDSQTKLIVIDCYQEWCGPTTAMQAFWYVHVWNT